MMKWLLLLLPSLALASGLKQTEAELRSRQIKNIIYDLSFNFEAETTTFEGLSKIDFDYLKSSEAHETFIELGQAKVASLALNGMNLPLSVYDGERIHLDDKVLRSGSNQLIVNYSHAFVNNGNGLQRFKDPVDNHVYISNHFEAYYAHLAFPCFDQPDLKAVYHVNVRAPLSWQVVMSTVVDHVQTDAKFKDWSFAPSPAMSSYFLNLAAGDFHVWENSSGRVPLRLFARESMAKYVEDRALFAILQEGLKFFEKEFGVPYPYAKLDLILAPNYAAGAMENMAAITSREEAVITRSPQVPSFYLHRTITLTHETSHQWFGDLVTMKWWNGLWLNESFADLMSYLATASIPEFKKSAWSSFFLEQKQVAYVKDQLVTTHPIETPVQDTDEARSNFDNITYNKGAAVLRQLRYFLSPEKFNKGLTAYFRKYSFANTGLNDFISKLAQAGKVDLQSWQEQWLKTTGVNDLHTTWSCHHGRIHELILTQENSPLREHKVLFGFLKWNHDHTHLIVQNQKSVTYKGRETKVSLSLPCPELVVPNLNDADYVNGDLDAVSLSRAKESLSKIEDELIREMLWAQLWTSVRNGKLPVASFIETAERQLPMEKNSEILEFLLSKLGSSAITYTRAENRYRTELRIETLIKERLEQSSAGSPEQLLYFRSFVSLARSPEAVQRLRGWLEGSALPPALELTQDRRWQVIQTLARSGVPTINSLIAAELRRDPTDSGRKSSYIADALIPNLKNKQKWFERFTRSSSDHQENSFDAGDLRTALRGFQDIDQSEIMAYFNKPYLDELAKMSGHEDNMYLQLLTPALFPYDCNTVYAKTAEAFLNEHQDIYSGVRKRLLEAIQEDEICHRARSL